MVILTLVGRPWPDICNCNLWVRPPYRICRMVRQSKWYPAYFLLVAHNGLSQPAALKDLWVVFHRYRYTDTDTDTRLKFIPIPIPIPILDWWFIPIPILLKPSYRYRYRYWYRYRYGTDTDTRYIYMLCAWYLYHTETGPHLGVEFFGVS